MVPSESEGNFWNDSIYALFLREESSYIHQILQGGCHHPKGKTTDLVEAPHFPEVETEPPERSEETCVHSQNLCRIKVKTRPQSQTDG